MSAAVPASARDPLDRSDRLLLALSRSDRQVTVGLLAVGSAAAWLYLAFGLPSGARHDAMGSMSMVSPWTAGVAATQLLMWAVMMLAMMLPAAVAPTLVYVAVRRKAERQGSPLAPASALVAGYVGMWLVFSVVATTAQWLLDRSDLLSSTMAAGDARLGGVILVASGVYQLTPLKAACLKRCRDPARLLADRWRPGTLGALRIGGRLGLYCLGCCWLLMALLFVGGLMNLFWVAAIATFILLEKIAPAARTWSRVVGAAMACGGLALVVG